MRQVSVVLSEKGEDESHHLAVNQRADQHATIFRRRRHGLTGYARRTPSKRLNAFALAALLKILQFPDFDARHGCLQHDRFHNSEFTVHHSFWLSHTLPNSSMDPGPKPA